MTRVRKAFAAGHFYAGTKEELQRQLQECYEGRPPAVERKGPRRVVAAIAPHAGYPYSGKVAAALYRRLAEDGPFETAVLIGPNHTGLGEQVAVMAQGEWETPLGRVAIDRDLARKLCHGGLIEDDSAHLYEHSIEVQLPFLQGLDPEIRIVPVSMLAQDLEIARQVGEIVSRAMEGRRHIILATTDLTHYEPHQVALAKDKQAIEAIAALDEERLFRIMREVELSMCGYGPVAAAIVAAREMGAKEASLVAYTTSAEATGDYSAVVGYGAMVMTRPQQGA
ncbi:MAG: AmmeMemoRadiSam system protein B [Chloroflexota bacterium]